MSPRAVTVRSNKSNSPSGVTHDVADHDVEAVSIAFCPTVADIERPDRRVGAEPDRRGTARAVDRHFIATVPRIALLQGEPRVQRHSPMPDPSVISRAQATDVLAAELVLRVTGKVPESAELEQAP